jgi:hypothetical protein
MNPVTVDSYTVSINGTRIAGSFAWDRAGKKVTFTATGMAFNGTGRATVRVNVGLCPQTFTWTWTVS